jgi:hypothetical protein
VHDVSAIVLLEGGVLLGAASFPSDRNVPFAEHLRVVGLRPRHSRREKQRARRACNRSKTQLVQ